VLVDLTRCIGCLRCEAACGEENGTFVPDINDKTVLQETRQMRPDQWTVVNRYETERGTVYVKRQCMHCDQPGCASACLTRAMHKTPEGPIIWRARKCMGCRFCMISCPFDVPKFEYFSANPKIQKCTLCYPRIRTGKTPACVTSCPVEALRFGKRATLLEVARLRIYNNPDQYVHSIYGEQEVAGTSWLYLSPVPFDQVGFRTDLGVGSVPELSRDFLYAVPVVLLLWPTFLFGVSQATARANAAGSGASEAKPGGRV
jgi:Fe-S-cluster-containing dehydrogenase component